MRTFLRISQNVIQLGPGRRFVQVSYLREKDEERHFVSLQDGWKTYVDEKPTEAEAIEAIHPWNVINFFNSIGGPE